MNLWKAQLERSARFHSWANMMAAADVNNDYALLQCLSHTPQNYGIWKNTIRKEKTEALKLWRITIGYSHRILAGERFEIKPEPEDELRSQYANGEHDYLGLVSFWREENGYHMVKGMRASNQDWENNMANWADGSVLAPNQIIQGYGSEAGEELGWEPLSTTEQSEYGQVLYKSIYKIEAGDWLIFPRIDFRTPQEECPGEAKYCSVQVYFQLLRKDEILAKSLLTQVVAHHQNVIFSPHQHMGLLFVGWHFRSQAHAKDVRKSYVQLLRIFHKGIELNLEDLNISN